MYPKGLLVAFAVTASLLWSASPAAAGQNYGCTADRVSGCVTFKPAGDKFEICDERADNYSAWLATGTTGTPGAVTR